MEKTNLRLIEVLNKKGERKSPNLPSGIKNFVIDIDGVVCEDIPNEEPGRMVNALEIPGAKEQINEWFNEGHIISFFSSRTEDLRKITEEWLSKNGFKYHNLILGKPRGGNYHYIDNTHVRATTLKGKFNKFIYRYKKIQTFE